MKVLMNLDDVTEKMEVAQDILDRNGRLLIPESTKLTKELIGKIREFTSYSNLLIKARERKFGIVVEKDNTEEVVEISSTQLEMADSQRRLELKERLGTMEKSLESTFAQLHVNAGDKKAKAEVEKTVEDIKNNISVNIDLLEEIVEIKDVDVYLYMHSLNVALLANLIGRWLKLGEKDLDILVRAGLLHDLGKLEIDPKILNKPGRLTDEEFEEMKKHSSYTYNLLKKAGYKDQELLKAVTFHHEKQDGSGYPLGISGNQIPIHARILAIADIFDAMTSERVYKKRVSPFKVLEMFQSQAFGKLDMVITMLFVKKFSEYYLGSYVTLSNGERARIISLNNYEVNKPLLKLDNGTFIDTSTNRTIEVLDFVELDKIEDKN